MQRKVFLALVVLCLAQLFVGSEGQLYQVPSLDVNLTAGHCSRELYIQELIQYEFALISAGTQVHLERVVNFNEGYKEVSLLNIAGDVEIDSFNKTESSTQVVFSWDFTVTSDISEPTIITFVLSYESHDEVLVENNQGSFAFSVSGFEVPVPVVHVELYYTEEITKLTTDPISSPAVEGVRDKTKKKKKRRK
jgi:hypothetical protein